MLLTLSKCIEIGKNYMASIKSFWLKKIPKTLFVIALCCLSLINIPAQYISEKPLEEQQFLKIKELLKIVAQAKRAGFSDEELDNLTISYGYKKILIKDVIKAYKNSPQNLASKRLDWGDFDEISLLEVIENKKNLPEKPADNFFDSQDIRAQLNASQKVLLSQLLEDAKKRRN